MVSNWSLAYDYFDVETVVFSLSILRQKAVISHSLTHSLFLTTAHLPAHWFAWFHGVHIEIDCYDKNGMREKSGMLEQGVKRSTTLQLLFSKLMMVVPVGSLSFSPNHRPHHLFLSMKGNMCLRRWVRCRCSTFQSVDEHKYTHYFNLCSSACLLFSQTEDVMTDWEGFSICRLHIFWHANYLERETTSFLLLFLVGQLVSNFSRCWWKWAVAAVFAGKTGHSLVSGSSSSGRMQVKKQQLFVN